jgi:hypothetical protein
MASQHQGQGFYLQRMAKKCGKKASEAQEEIAEIVGQHAKLKGIDKNR